MTDWRLKIFAYLHDPPDKPLALGREDGHAAWGRELARRLGAEPAAGDEARWNDLVARADRLGAGADRTGLLPRGAIAVDELRHPLSGQRIDLAGAGLDLRDPALREGARRALEEEIGHIAAATTSDPQLAFLALWGLLPARLRDRRSVAGDPPELRGAWDLLPAETRMPNHPVPAHQGLVSALATVLAEGDRAALLAVSVGPVQRFIAQARRSSDLWAGSVLLAQAMLHAVRPVVEALGPDHVIFPALRSSRAFLGWLLRGSSWSSRLRRLWPHGEPPDWRSSGGLPNRFVALVPAGRAHDLGQACARAVAKWWAPLVDEDRGPAAVPRAAEGVAQSRPPLVDEHATWLEEAAPGLAGYAAMAAEQAHGFFRVTWAATPWPLVDALPEGGVGLAGPAPAGEGPAAAGAATGPAAGAAWLRGGVLPEPLDGYLATMRQARTTGTPDVRPFAPNGGLLYAACYEAVERLVGAGKLTPPGVPREEGGLKCSLCGERAVVPTPMRFAEQRAMWRRVRDRVSERQPGLLRPGEALCGICWAKRRFGTEEREQGVPSTAEIAASPFKRAVLRALAGDGPPPEFVRAVQKLCEAVEADRRFGDAFVVPALRVYKDRDGLAGRFARVAGEILLAHPREDREPDDEPVPDELVRAAARLRREARQAGIAPPRPYLAALVLDGDEMGKWLGGAHALPLGRYLTRQAQEQLREILRPHRLEGLLETRWPMTPALHAALSEACGVFSQRTARRTVEAEDTLGVLIYAGGDDVLALVPAGQEPGPAPRGAAIEHATETARRLRFRFSGHVRRAAGGVGDEADPASPAGFVVDGEGLGLALGERATASAGVAVFHQRWPLGRALEEARRAEQYAKETLGRDALGLAILRRSGQGTVTGLGFRERGDALPELLELALPIARTAADRHATGGAWPEAEACLRRLAKAACPRRREASDRCDEPEAGVDPTSDPVGTFQALCRAFADGGPLSPRLVSELGMRLGPLAAEGLRSRSDRAGDGEPDEADNAADAARHLERWLGLVEAAAFLGRGGEA